MLYLVYLAVLFRAFLFIMKEELEIWKEVDGFNGVYFVSNKGNVKSVDHYCKGRKGSGKQTGRVLKLSESRKGYLRVSLSKDCKKFNTSAHRLVAKAFIPNPKNKEQVNHKDCDKKNNHVSNLEWCTGLENRRHAQENGRDNPNYGEDHHNSKLSNNQVLEARKLREKGCTINEIAIRFNVSKTAMCKIVNRVTYPNVK